MRLNSEETSKLPVILSSKRVDCIVCNALISVHTGSRDGVVFKFTIHEHANDNGVRKYPEEVTGNKG